MAGEMILVTGGAGFIGSSLVRRLVHDGHEVCVLDDLSSGVPSNLEDVQREIEFVRGDLRDVGNVARIVQKAEVVYHLGAIPSVQGSITDPESSLSVGITGTLNVLMTARESGVRRVVLASSSSVYGNNLASPKTESLLPDPLSPYALSKLTGEHLCRIYSHVYGLDTVALRFFNVYGPRQNPFSEYSAVIPRFVHQAITGETPVIYGDGEQTRDFVYIDDVVDAIMLAGRVEGISGKVFNIGSQIATSINDLVKVISETLGRPLTPTYVDARPGDIKHSIADISAAKLELGYSALTTLQEGIRRVHSQWAPTDA
jgi:UDP-glucose 4-epimerase